VPVRLDGKWRHAMLEPGDERERAKAVQRWDSGCQHSAGGDGALFGDASDAEI